MSALARNYNRRKIAFKRGKGSYLYAANGKKYLDFVQGIAVNSLGHANPYLINAIKKQSKRVWAVSNSFIIPESERLARILTQKTFADYVIFQNSGTECIEAAIKVARRYFYSIGKPNKNRIICIKNSFHGRTLAAIFASGSKKMTEGFGPKVEGFDHFEFEDHKSLKKLITSKTAAIMIEDCLGEGGCKLIPDWSLRELRKICNKKKILLIIDAIQSGVGRAGKFFAFEYAKIKPDIALIAKGLGGGFPIGAVLMSKKVAFCLVPGTHGSTFGGNPLATFISAAVLHQIFKKGFLNNVQKISKYFHCELNKIKDDYPKLIKEVRGVGLLVGLQLFNDQTKFIQKLTNNKLLTIRAAEYVVRLLPPLNVKKQEIDLAIKIIRKVCKKFK
jgi:acetylornithine/N-succinyldiaminopimelate aminotransferase